MKKTQRTRLLVIAALAFAGVVGPAAAQKTTITWLVSSSPADLPAAKGIVADFQAANPDIKVELETRPSGSEGDNIIKTRLATKTMADVFTYNSGSLFRALNPGRNLVDLTGEPWMAGINDYFKQAVGFNGRVYGAPYGTSMAGGIFYNRKIYEKLGLKVPKTWGEFMANNDKIKKAGLIPVIQTYADPWTSQVLVLSDFYNLQAQVPTFAADYTAGKAKYAKTPAALSGFERLQKVREAGYVNPDFASAKFADGLRMLAEGKGAHYPMLTTAINALKNNQPAQLGDIGFFAQPGDDAANNGLTVWMPVGMYIAASSSNIPAAKRLVAFVASAKGCESRDRVVGATGPYLVKECTLPKDVPPVVADLLPYFDKGGKMALALEFVSPIKGPALQQFTVEVGSGIRPAAEGAALYDEDVRKQAQQLGLPGW